MATDVSNHPEDGSAPPVPQAHGGVPRRPGAALVASLSVVACALTALLVAMLSNPFRPAQAASGQSSVRAGVAVEGQLSKTLRVGGTVETLDYAAIRAPQMRGPRDSGRADLTLMRLAEAGSLVKAGDVVAEFELRWLEDHIEDRASAVSTARSNYRRLEADTLILKETERQGRLTAKAEFDKAALDVRTAEVRSDIEAEVLRNMAAEAKATWEQLEEEGGLMEVVHDATLRVEELTVQEEVLHVERHERDYERLRVQTPIDGMVVRETMFNRSGQFSQTKEGDQIYPGALFMRIVDVANMVLAASVNQVDSQSVRIGNRAVIELDAYPGERFTGRVVDLGAVATASGGGKSRYRRPSSGEFVKQIPVRILIEDQDKRILPDLSASADVVLSRVGSGVLVPREAVRRNANNGSLRVWVRDGEEFLERSVQVGGWSDTEALVSSGLKAGEEVLLSDPPVAERAS